MLSANPTRQDVVNEINRIEDAADAESNERTQRQLRRRAQELSAFLGRTFGGAAVVFSLVLMATACSKPFPTGPRPTLCIRGDTIATPPRCV